VFSITLLVCGYAIKTAVAAMQKDEPETLPSELSNAEYDSLVQAVLNDKSVQEYTNGTQYKVMSYDFIGNTNDKPFLAP
jgi:hypothetical protein